MRVSNLLFLGALLTVMSSASEVLRGRALHGKPEDTRSVNGYTNVFTYEKDTRGKPETYEGGYQIGLIVGFITTWSFMVFGIFTIIRDEINRHYRFRGEVQEDEGKLVRHYGCSSEDMLAYEKEFRDREKLRNMNVKEREALERAALAEIN